MLCSRAVSTGRTCQGSHARGNSASHAAQRPCTPNERYVEILPKVPPCSVLVELPILVRNKHGDEHSCMIARLHVALFCVHHSLSLAVLVELAALVFFC